MNIYRQILTKYWGYPNFRPLQEDIILSVAEDGKDTLGLLPTGGGKSLIFQVPAMAKEGLCLVITPLIALMKDQVDNLNRRGIKAVAIHSGLTRHEIEVALNNCQFGNTKFIYLSPERLGTELFQARVVQMKISLIAVDEAHCISQWGYDFRPSYLKIAEIRKLLPGVPVLALTATATPDVVDDIQEKLLFKEKNVFKKSFERKNLIYIVRNVEDKLKYLLQIVTKMNASGVVYVRNRKHTREISDFLKTNGLSSDYFHAGLTNEIKTLKQNAWKTGQCKIIVSTNAFGMGIDKSDVRFVVHMDFPDSLEAYFQEAGRGGRDEKTAFAVLLYNQADIRKLEKSILTTFPEKEVIRKVYNALGNFYQIPVGGGKELVLDFNMATFASNYNFDILTIYNSIKILEAEGYIELTDDVDNPSLLKFIVNRQDLYKFQVANEKFDNFIKLVLRSYTGVFSEYVKIDEDSLARQAGSTRDVVYQFLVQMSKYKIIHYIPQKHTPLLIYTEERLDDRSLFFSPVVYKNRKEKYIERINSVIHYATSLTKCRQQMLLEYFGESDLYRCGKCDVCNKRNELNLSKYEFDCILEKLKAAIKKEPLLLEHAVDSLPDSKPDNVLKVIQWLLDNNKIIYLDDKRLRWVN
jgi:ATP-dependent DNA helicase RecQ